MPIEKLPSLLALILAIGYSPGPANIFSLMCSMKNGRKAALRMWLGLLVGFTIAALILTLATHCIGEAMGQYVKYIKYAGAAYILYLAWKTYSASGEQQRSTRGCSFLSGMVVQLTNAKILLFELMVFSTFVLPYSDSLTDLLSVAVLLELAGPGANLVWLLMGGFLHRVFSKHQRKMEIAMALCLAACAIAIVL